MLKNLRKYRQVLSYLFWGILTTVVSWATYGVFVKLLQDKLAVMVAHHQISADILLANLLSWICAVAFAFITNKMWVFESREWKKDVVWQELWKFVSARIATGIVEIITVPVLVAIGLNSTVFGVEGAVAKVLVSIVVIILNYFFSKVIVFKHK